MGLHIFQSSSSGSSDSSSSDSSSESDSESSEEEVIPSNASTPTGRINGFSTRGRTPRGRGRVGRPCIKVSTRFLMNYKWQLSHRDLCLPFPHILYI